MFKRNISLLPLTLLILFSFGVCKKNNGAGQGNNNNGTTPTTSQVEYWLTRADQTALLQKQPDIITFTGNAGSYPSIAVDPGNTFQTVDGFGYTLTGSSAYLISQLDETTRNSLLQELFGNSSTSMQISCLRISMGASDLSRSVFSYDDLPAGQTDPLLTHFSLSQDTVDLIPVLKKIVAINPSIKILASPWSPPVWMKSNGNSMGGNLLSSCYSVYADYFVKYIRQMKANGINIEAVTVQNEPEHGGNNPSMLMSAAEQAAFIKNNLGPAFRAAGISTKIITWDHNCDNTAYPINVLNDAAAASYIDGSAFHLYAGSISALSSVHALFPAKNIYFTEQWTGSTGSFDGDFKWHIKNVIIGSMRNWSKMALEWNLANDPLYQLHTPGGCTQCKGALTLDAAVTRNVSYYIIAQISKFVPAGAVRIASTETGSLSTVAFTRPDGKIVLLVLNEGSADISFNISFNGKYALTHIPANAAGTFIW